MRSASSTLNGHAACGETGAAKPSTGGAASAADLRHIIDNARAFLAALGIDEEAEVCFKFRSGRQLVLPIHQQQALARHGPDFRCVDWFGTKYEGRGGFSPSQAAVIRVLWAAWENGTPDVGHETLLDAAGTESTSSLSNLFNGHPAWGTLVTSEKKGSYRLQEPTACGEPRTA